MPILIQNLERVGAYAVVVDINKFVPMVHHAVQGWSGGMLLGSFVRDTLSGAIAAIEEHDGDVVSVMGDAILAVVPEGPHIYSVCVSVAKDLDKIWRSARVGEAVSGGAVSARTRARSSDHGVLDGSPVGLLPPVRVRLQPASSCDLFRGAPKR